MTTLRQSGLTAGTSYSLQTIFRLSLSLLTSVPLTIGLKYNQQFMSNKSQPIWTTCWTTFAITQIGLARLLVNLEHHFGHNIFFNGWMHSMKLWIFCEVYVTIRQPIVYWCVISIKSTKLFSDLFSAGFFINCDPYRGNGDFHDKNKTCLHRSYHAWDGPRQFSLGGKRSWPRSQ